MIRESDSSSDPASTVTPGRTFPLSVPCVNDKWRNDHCARACQNWIHLDSDIVIEVRVRQNLLVIKWTLSFTLEAGKGLRRDLSGNSIN